MRRAAGHLCDYILLDEAWAGFMKFHPLFSGHYAMSLDRLGPDDPGIIATQSTHKQLAGFSQASQIHLKSRHIEGQPRHVSELRFNEAYMLHASTSPFYPLFSSLDVGAQMMKGRNGFHLWNEATRLAVEMRKTIRRLLRTFEAEAGEGAPPPWFFDPFVPDAVTVTGSPHTADLHDVPWEEVPTPVLLAEQQCWQLRPGARWHGFTRVADGYAMTDPNKLTLVTPGFDRETGGYLDWGVPAPMLAEFLRERGIIPEKNDLNTILFLVTPGIEVSKAGTLITTLLEFKRFFDGNLPLRDVLPEFVAARPQVYGDERLRDLCLRMHDFYRKGRTSELQRQQFEAGHFPEMALSPQEATRLFTANQIDYVPIDEVSGRVAATMALVYPPGIGVVVPGRMVAELLRNPADAAANAELPYRADDRLRHRFGGRGVRALQSGCEESLAPRVVHIQPGHGKPPCLPKPGAHRPMLTWPAAARRFLSSPPRQHISAKAMSALLPVAPLYREGPNELAVGEPVHAEPG